MKAPKKPLRVLRPTAFQIYDFLWDKLELLPAALQEKRIVNVSKAEIEREFGFSINTIRSALDFELEREFNLIRKLPDEPGKQKNRILLVPEKEWNWELIRTMVFDKTKKNQRGKSNEASIFDDLTVYDGGSIGKIPESSDE